MIIEDHIYLNQKYRVYFQIANDGETHDLSGATLQVRHKDPSGNVGYLTATEVEYDGEQNIYADMPEDDNDEVGWWELRSWITFAGDNNPTPGVPFDLEVEAI